MKHLLLCAAALLSLSSASQATTTIEGGATDVTFNTGDPGLVITASPVPFGPFDLDLDVGTLTPSSFTTDVLSIGTDETTINLFEDTNSLPISVGFSFTNPFGTTGDPITGETFGVWLIDIGVVRWDGPSTFNFGNGGAFSLALSDTIFGTPGTANVSGTFTLISESAVPEPATWAMMLMGFGAVGFAMRRKRSAERPLAQIA
jgi:hypothetical protein